MALKVLDIVRHGAWALLALSALLPGTASAQMCDPELAAVAIVLEAAPDDPSESHPFCAFRDEAIAGPQSLRAGGSAAPVAAARHRERSAISPAARVASPLSSSQRDPRYCARSARLLC